MINKSRSQEYAELFELIRSMSTRGPKEFYTVTEACQLLGISRTTLYYMRVNKLVEERRISQKKVVITKRSIDDLVFGNANES